MDTNTQRPAGCLGLLRRAAMEPAVGRREHRAAHRKIRAHLRSPQWSPPLEGGNTGIMGYGGSPVLVSRNGARRWKAGTPAPCGSGLGLMLMPQWSPPLEGGN